MGEFQFFLISANKSRPPGMRWSDDDYDVREGGLGGLGDPLGDVITIRFGHR